MKAVKICTAALALTMMIALLVQPQRYAQSVANGLAMYVMAVLPSMLPFFFLSGLLTGTGIAGKLSNINLTKKVFHAPGEGLYVMMMSMLSGYPVGAKLIAEMYDAGIVDSEGAVKMVSFTSATGPMFVVGAVGAQILGDYRAGLLILVSHYAATVINGLLYRGRRKPYGVANNVACPVKMDKLLWETAYNTAVSLMVAAVYIVIFNMAADMIADTGLITLLTKGLHFFGIRSDAGTAVLFGLTEMTRGCVLLSQSGLPIAGTAPLCCMLVSFGGLSVLVQSVAYLAKCHVNPLYFVLTKITQGAMAYGICRCLCVLFL